MNRVKRRLLLVGLLIWAWLTGAITPAAPPATNVARSKTTIPYVPTRHDTVRELLWMAETGTNDVVYDLGSGDGRVVIAAVRDFHARRAVGIELDAALLQASRSNAVAGVWRGKVRTESGQGELKLVLHQRLSGVSGSYQLQGPTNLTGSVTADLWGDQLRCWLTSAQDWLRNQMWVDARVEQDSLKGGLRMFFGTNSVELEWLAHRDPADFTGTWEWAGVSNAPVQLKIERRDGRLAAIYTDKIREKTQWRDDTQPIPIFDLYPFGGGFYFTLLLGLEGNRYSGSSRRMGPQDGWLVGEAVLEDGRLHGTLAFYPHSSTLNHFTDAGQPQPANRKTPSAAGRRDWQPRRVAP